MLAHRSLLALGTSVTNVGSSHRPTCFERDRSLDCAAMTTRLRAVFIAVALTIVSAACGGSDEPKVDEHGNLVNPTAPDRVEDIPDDWDPAEVERLQTLAADVVAGPAGICTDVALMTTTDFANVLFTLQRAEVIPTAIGSCTVVGDESIELAVFVDDRDRDAYVAERHDIICARAVAQNEYRFVRCGDDTKQVDWDPDALRRIRDLGRALDEAGYPCDFQIEDIDIIGLERHYVEIGLPGALGSCTTEEATFGPDLAPTFGMAGFANGFTPADEFIPAEVAELCSAGADVRVVEGEGWAAFVVGPGVVSIVMEVLGGAERPTKCPTPLTTTTDASSGPTVGPTTSAP
jgi:hypothetical protein